MTAFVEEAEHDPEHGERTGPDTEAPGQASPPEGGVAAEPLRRSATVRDALLLWVGTRAGMLLVAVYGILIVSGQNHAPLLERWKFWDVDLFRKIAEFGYDGDPKLEPDPGLPAFFPGLPLALRLVHLVVDDWTLAGLIISFVAGAVAVVALARLADFEGPAGAGRWAVLALLLCPPAVFLFAGYSEALFLAFALPAWLAARRRAWPLACALAAGASCVRITGLFLAVALIVEFVVSRIRRDGWAGWWRGPGCCCRSRRSSRTPPTSTPVRVTGWPGTTRSRPDGGGNSSGPGRRSAPRGTRPAATAGSRRCSALRSRRRSWGCCCSSGCSSPAAGPSSSTSGCRWAR
ncbi:hypothetical protein [Microbispora sp. GKU 823]|uniref:hypothetical protein n=1 Tax=Microbispora sp. GKU 823 TaxID=1652100 RepID=UPI0009A2B33E|nr:hypothetical protein [Microbispora sp. GKU 823]